MRDRRSTVGRSERASRSSSLPLRQLTRLVIAMLALAPEASAQEQAAAPPAVQIAPVKLAQVTDTSSFVGSIVAIQQVDLRARVEGFLDQVPFKEGSFLPAGSLAFSIEKAPYEAALNGAEANLASATATKAGNEANLRQAELTLKRQQTLVRSDAVAQAAVDQATASRDLAAAQVQQAAAQIQAAQAQIEQAQLNLSYTQIRTPIAGRIGKAQVTRGNLVTASSGTLATVVQADPIRVVFSISDLGYLAVVDELKPNDQGVPSNPTRYTPRLRLSDGSDYPSVGKIAFMDNAVDPSTGTIAVYADFPNPNLQLLPGQYVDVTVEAGEAKSLPVVPAAAVQLDQDGAYVFVLGEGNRAVTRRIKTGARVGIDWAVSSGLASGDVVIVSGIQKIRPGIVVAPEPAPGG
jgi:membrane fusion protein (multidrug efflux system)